MSYSRVSIRASSLIAVYRSMKCCWSILAIASVERRVHLLELVFCPVRKEALSRVFGGLGGFSGASFVVATAATGGGEKRKRGQGEERGARGQCHRSLFYQRMTGPGGFAVTPNNGLIR